MKLEDKTILIVGASSGIGRATAVALADRNNRLVVCARRQDLLETLELDIEARGSQCLFIETDALDRSAAESVIDASVEKFGGIDVALLNVGEGPSFNMDRCSVDEVWDNMALNYLTMVNYLIPLIQQMKKQGHGLIAHTNSLAGFLGLPMQGPYSAAKAAARILMDACRLELREQNIKFVSLHPGFVATERVANDGIPTPFEISEAVAARHVIKGIEREKPDYLFPLVMKLLIRLAGILPKPVTGYLLLKAIPDEY
ncbi:MAG: SDR family NAD(P)-dependent oxidoreductase [Deltaproteobacteria bacterium]|nr:SDR family NAD(P)-dependent oxidoreductase [Deltaproteobacteria bacterium]